MLNSMVRRPKRSPQGSVVAIDEPGRRARVLAKRDRLVEEHLDLVPPIAKRIHHFLPPSFDLEDLIATGNLALTRAAMVYRPKAHGGCPFSAFARHRVRGAILDSVRRRHFTENTRISIDSLELPYDLSHLDRDRAPAVEANIETDLSRRQLLNRLTEAVQRLTDEQKALLEYQYADDVDRVERAHWRKRKQVIEMHRDILAILKSELAS